jgi:hypothetical protein
MRTELLGVMDLISLRGMKKGNGWSRIGVYCVVQEINQHKSKYYMRGLSVWSISKSIEVCLSFFLFAMCASVNGLFLNYMLCERFQLWCQVIIFVLPSLYKVICCSPKIFILYMYEQC